MLPKSIVIALKGGQEMKDFSLIKSFPLILDDFPKDYVQQLEKQYRWKLNEKPSTVIRRWKEKESKEQFYFLGWFVASVYARGVPGNMRILNLKTKRLVDDFMKAILEEASEEEIKSFEKGKADMSYFDPQ